MSRALADLRILDLGWAMAGPQATRILADFGADVIKIESRARLDLGRTLFGPHVGERSADSSGYFNNFNRNKRSATINMSRPEGREIFARLVTMSDAVLENFSAGVMENWGLDYDGLRRLRPDIVYVSMAGLGHSGPYRDYAGSELTLQAMGGPLHTNGTAEREPLKLETTGERIYGRGTTDMKGFIAQCLDAARTLDATKLRRPLVFVFTASEGSTCVT